MTESLDTPVSRRHVLTILAAGAAAVAGGGVLAGCGDGGGGETGTTDKNKLNEILPQYAADKSVVPDIASASGPAGAISNPCFLKYPASPAKTVNGKVGSGGTYTTMTPLWGAIPPSSGNTYYDTVNKAIGATLKMQPADGNNFGNSLPPLFAADKLPDWIQIPSWNTTNLGFGQAVSRFVDLTPHLSGDKIKKYPNLMAIPQAAWASGVWNGKLYGIPSFSTAAKYAGLIFYRKDMFEKLGVSPEIKSADDLFNLGKQLTNATAGKWAFDDLWTYLASPFKISGTWSDVNGKLTHKYETQNIIEALNWQAKVVKAGYMHPDAVAGNNQNAKQRFQSGKVAITGDGQGAWVGDDAKAGAAADPAYNRQAFKLFTWDGNGTPTIDLGNGASMFSYLNKKLSDAQVKECLAIANYLAAPYGSAEYLVVNFGAEGTDYTMKDSNPVLTELGSKEVATTFQFLASPAEVTSVTSGYTQVAKDYAVWHADSVKYAVKPMFFGMNVTEPAQFASIGQAVEDTLLDVRYGRKPVSAFTDAVAAWRKQGGDDLRKFYEDIRSKNGTGQ